MEKRDDFGGASSNAYMLVYRLRTSTEEKTKTKRRKKNKASSTKASTTTNAMKNGSTVIPPVPNLPTDVKAVVDKASQYFQNNVNTYDLKKKMFLRSIETRKRAYEMLFQNQSMVYINEGGTRVEMPGSLPFTDARGNDEAMSWVPTIWLRSWITGKESLKSSTTVAAMAAAATAAATVAAPEAVGRSFCSPNEETRRKVEAACTVTAVACSTRVASAIAVAASAGAHCAVFVRHSAIWW
jgi:hypothetical protein